MGCIKKLSIALALVSLSIMSTATNHITGTQPTNSSSPQSSFTFAIAGDFSRNPSARSVTSIWGQSKPTLSIGLGDYAYDNIPPSTWCTSFWNAAVGTGDGFLAVGDHDTFANDRLTNAQSYGYWENSTGYAATCGLKGSGINWVGSATVSNNHACSPSSNFTLFDTCFGREMYVDYPSVSPLVRFILLCDGIASHPNTTAWCNYGSAGTDASNHLSWLDNTVSAARNASIRWIIVLNHDHDWTAGPYGISYSSALWNHLIADKVDVFITAEEHNYQRSYPLLCPTSDHDWYQNQNTSVVQSCIGDSNTNTYRHGEGMLYLITGTGGQSHNPFNTADPNWIANRGYFSALNDTTWGFNLFNITQTTISATFTPVIGSFIDRWSITYTPTVITVLPGQGSSGTRVTINGSHFIGATNVSFCTLTQAAFEVINDTTITTIAPNITSATPLSCDIQVSSKGGISVLNLGDQFVYLPNGSTGGPAGGRHPLLE